MSNKYDYIIAGAGLAGLSLAYKIRKDKSLDDKRILLVDKDQKNKNDRTWCFWSNTNEDFESIVFKRWPSIRFANNDFEKQFDIKPYQYKMIRGIDFYRHVKTTLESAPNTDFITSDIHSCTADAHGASLRSSKGEFNAPYIFKSYYENLDFSKSNFVWQHFKGWIIETESPAFDDQEAIFMDFRVPQGDETRFFYVLPFGKNKALVEIAIFSGEIPEANFYDPFLKTYIRDILKIKDYSIEEEELGAIPMTDYQFTRKQSPRIINIGTNGGRVKPSSGYAFVRIQEENNRLFSFLKNENLDAYSYASNRYGFYDSVLLNAILTGKTSGEQVFSNLFSKLKPQTIFKFLDEKGSFFNDLLIFTAPPTLPFMKAFFEEIRK